MIKFPVFILLLSIFNECVAASDPSQWAMVTEPVSQGGAQSIGSYTAGCLSGAVSLPANGTGYQLMRLSRKRYYGHPDLIQFIQKLGQTAADRHWGTLLVGDLAQPRGGPALSGHRSHHTGLDVDIWFLLSEQASARMLAYNERETWSAPSVLFEQSDSLDSSQWSGANEQILEAAARMPEVDRIFVNASVKRQLCKNRASQDWLRKIRPWWKHDDHFHVRLKCPGNNVYCRSQEPLPPGDGCDASLAWWFSAEAKSPSTQPPPPKAPILPPQCDGVLHQAGPQNNRMMAIDQTNPVK